MEAGYLTVEIEQLQLGLKAKSEKELQLRLDLAIVDGYNVFQWVSTGDEKFSTSVFNPILQSDPEGGDSVTYLSGFNNQFLRSTFIDLNDEVMNGLANATLVVNVVSLNDKPPEAVAAKPAKGAAPVEAKPAEESLIKISLPLHVLLTAKNCTINLFQSVAELLQQAPFNTAGACVLHANVVDATTSLTMKISADNDFAEYALGSKVLQWENAQLLAPPAVWGLHAIDVLDPKAKVPATAAELRTKYLDNIAKLVNDQTNVCAFELSIGASKDQAAQSSDNTDEEVESSATARIQGMFPFNSLGKGKIAFNQELAASVPVSDDIRARGDLWSISWTKSPVLFMHRKIVRQFTMLLLQNPASAYLPLNLKKTPGSAFMEVEGGVQTLAGKLSIQKITNSGAVKPELFAALDGNDLEDTKFSVKLSLSSPLLPTSALEKLTADLEKEAAQKKQKGILKKKSDIPEDILSGKAVTGGDSNRDVLKELRAEISSTIEKIGQEYVSLYPEPTQSMPTLVAAANSTSDPTSQTSPRGNHVQTQEERKLEFLEFLSTNGIFHEMKESLKPKVQLLIKERYGNRGRALGKSQALASVDLNRGDADKFQVTQEINEASIEALLSELYVFLLKECSLVLNSMFTDTLIARDTAELEKTAFINDEAETQAQLVQRLLNQARDAAASGNHDIANAVHLERMQIINHSPTMGPDVDLVHGAYAAYGEFLLQQSASVLASASTVGAELQVMLLDKAQSLLGKARSALNSAYKIKPSAWQVALLYAGILVELDQSEQAEVVLQDVLRTQLAGNYKGKEFALQSFSEFDGYDSDALCPVDPMCYSVLASLFHLQGHALKARKALVLANRSFTEGDYKPDVSTHGSPRRTIVLTLAETGLHMFKHSLVRLGQGCVQLAVSSEAAVTAKATARGKPASTVPHIKYLLKRVQSVSALYAASSAEAVPNIVERLDQAVQLSRESQQVADSAVDEVQAWGTVAIALQLSGGESAAVIEAYLNSVGASRKLPVAQVKSEQVVPLELFIQTARLLLLGGRFNQARTILLYACSIYSSATLFMLLGVCYLRLDELEDAEAALVEANLLDNRNASVWAYLSLVCVSSGPHRLVEAERSLEQALRLGQDDAQVLRELATSFMSVDKLQIAEDLIRRALRKESVDNAGSAAAMGGNSTSKYTSNARTRRLLADILAGQNQAVKAVEEYQRIIADEGADLKTKLEVAERCSELLSSLGRDEELVTLKSIIASLSQDNNGRGE